MATKRNAKGCDQLKIDLKTGQLGQLYIISGEEAYLKNHYLGQIQKALVQDDFAQFNLQQFEGKGMTPEAFTEAVEGYPAFAERKLVIVRDFDLYKPPAAFQPVLLDTLSDLPEYICLVFYYDVLPFKADKRTKMHALLEKKACFAEFDHLDDRQLREWILRRVRALGKDMDPETCEYLVFLCGNDMTNLIGEIEKAAAHSTLHEIKRYSIDEVCTPVLDAVIFDLTDAITQSRFDRAISIVGELLAQKNTEVAVFSAVLRHIQRLYAAKLCEQYHSGGKELLALIGSNSSYYAQKLTRAARNVSLAWLRNAVRICGDTDAALKSSAADKQKIIELALLQMASTIED